MTFEIIASPPPLDLRYVEPEHLVGDMIQPEHPLFGVIWINRERVSGNACFFGTRVMVGQLFEALAEGQSLEYFLDAYEGVHRDQALCVLHLAAHGLFEKLNALEDTARSQPRSAPVEIPAGA